MTTILGVLIILLGVLTAYNIGFLRTIKKRLASNKNNDSDENYYKLNTKIDLIQYIGIGLLSVLSLLGYNQISDLSSSSADVKQLKNQVDDLISNVEKLNLSLEKVSSEKEKIEKDFRELYKDVFGARLELENTKSNLKNIAQNIPERNIQIIAEELSTVYMTFLLQQGYLITDEPPSDEQLMQDFEKIQKMLEASGMTKSEANSFIVNIYSKVGHVRKLNLDKLK
jgi:hypothetical protein